MIEQSSGSNGGDGGRTGGGADTCFHAVTRSPAAGETGGPGNGQTPSTPVQARSWEELALGLAKRLEASLDGGGPLPLTPEVEGAARQQFAALYRQERLNLSPQQAKALYQRVMEELLGYGPLEAFLRDDSVTEIMVNAPDLVYVERRGKLEETAARFVDDSHVLRVIERILQPLGRRVDTRWPVLDARLPDGSRVNVVVPPCAIHGPTLTIRKFSSKCLSIEDLIGLGSVSPEIAEFLRACVLSRLNIIVCGGTGSGKTTLLNLLSSYIPADERIVTIEDLAELQLHQRHVVTLEAKPADPDGTGRVTIRDLVINALRMCPDRVVVGECRGGEALDMLQAINTGHDGSLTTLHSNSPRDALACLETMVLMAGMELPLRVVREQIASAVDLIVQQARLRDGSRKIISVTEVQGMEGDVIVLQDIFQFREEGLDENGRVRGRFAATGGRPRFMPRLEASGAHLPVDLFATPEVAALQDSARRPPH